MEIYSSDPLNVTLRALLKDVLGTSLLIVGVFWCVPVLPLPEESAADDPEVSSSFQYPIRESAVICDAYPGSGGSSTATIAVHSTEAEH